MKAADRSICESAVLDGSETKGKYYLSGATAALIIMTANHLRISGPNGLGNKRKILFKQEPRIC